NTVILRVGDVQIARSIHSHRPWRAQGCGDGTCSVSEVRGVPVTRHCPDLSIGEDFADAIIRGVDNQQIALIVQRHALRVIQLCLDCRTAVARESRDTVPRYRSDRSVKRDLADAVILRIGEVYVARDVDRHPGRYVQLGPRRRREVARKTAITVARYSG